VQSSDRIFEPVKIIKGRSLDVWILDKSANELVNFNNLGIFVKRVKVPGGLIPINIANIGQYIVTLFDGEIIFYDVDKGVYTAVYYFPKFFDLKDLVLLDKETIFILQKKEIFKFTIK
jgi:hypothetical protein